MIQKKIPYCLPEAEELEMLTGSLICDSGVLDDPGDYVDGGDPLNLI